MKISQERCIQRADPRSDVAHVYRYTSHLHPIAFAADPFGHAKDSSEPAAQKCKKTTSVGFLGR